ncbi:MAG: ABC transporter permease [Acidimicrobiia bacterium]|nr:ABC transporter permease [Acidimicrobiia bacterium]
MSSLLAIAKTDLVITLRRGESVLLTFLIPLGLLFFVGATGILGIEVDHLVPGLFALSLISSAFVGLAVATGFERKYLVLKRLGATPIRPLTLVLGKALSVAIVEVLQLALLWIVAAAVFDWNPDVRWPGLLAAVVLGTMGPAGLAFLMAGRLRAEATLALANGLYFLFLGIGDVFVPASYLSDGVVAISRLLPAAPLAEVFRWSTGAGDVTTGAWVVLAAWALLAPLAAARWFRWEE